MQLLNRYFLDTNILKTIDKSYKKNTIIEFPTHINECKSVFYQKIKNDFFKIKIINNKIVYKKKITKKIYLKKRKNNSLSDITEKKIYKIDDSSSIVINKDIIYLETDKEKILNRYKNYIKHTSIQEENILLNPDKNRNTDIYKIFKKLEKMENIEMKNIFENESSINNIIRIKLYELYIKLSQKKIDLLNKELYTIDTISSYKNIALSIIILLSEFKDIFDKELSFKVIENLNYVVSKTQAHVKIKSITKQLKSYKLCLDNDKYIEFLKKEDLSITDDIDSFLHFLQTREYYIIMKQLEILIKENTIEHNLSKVADFNILINKSIKKRYKKLNRSIKKYIDCEDKESYAKIYKKIEKLYILNQEFSTFFLQKKYYKRKQILSRLKNDFNDFIEAEISQEIAKTLFKNKELNCILKNQKKSRNQKIKDIYKSIKTFKKSKKLFVS